MIDGVIKKNETCEIEVDENEEETRRLRQRGYTHAVLEPLLCCVGQFCDAVGRRRCCGRCCDVGS